MDEQDTVPTKFCFVISPIGASNSDIRHAADEVLNNVIIPIAEDQGYETLRADQIGRPGVITEQILTNLIKADLVIAVLTGASAIVFYELAIRHATNKPCTQIIDDRETIPFDVRGLWTIYYNPTSWTSARTCGDSLRRAIASIESGEAEATNIIYSSIGVVKQLQSDNPEVRAGAELVQMVNSLTETMAAQIQRLDKSIAQLQSSITVRNTTLDPAWVLPNVTIGGTGVSVTPLSGRGSHDYASTPLSVTRDVTIGPLTLSSPIALSAEKGAINVRPPKRNPPEQQTP